MSVKRVFVEKKPEYAIKARELREEIESYLDITGVTGVRVLVRYDIENISEDVYVVFSVEYLPGQFDQRADSAEQCVKLLNENEEPVIRSAMTYVISGKLSAEEITAIKSFCINPVDSREASEEIPETLVTVFDVPEDVAVFDGFKDMDEAALKELYSSLNLAMTFKDFLHIQNYYKNEEHRDPRPGYVLVRSLPPYHILHRTQECDIHRGRLQETDRGYLQPVPC